MKKYLVILVLALYGAVQSNAQITWNVRAGGGLVTDMFNVYDSHFDFEVLDYTENMGLMFAVEANIPVTQGSNWCVSPTAIVSYGENCQVSLPIYWGYKHPVGDSKLLIPKVGPFVGIDTDGAIFLFGPSVELAYEHKHFVTAINASLNTITRAVPYIFLSVGYKF